MPGVPGVPGVPLVQRSDDELMRLLQRASARHRANADAAYRVLEQRYGGKVLRVVRSILHDPVRAADAATETLESLWLKRSKYQPGTNFAAWLLTLARNHALSTLRRERRATRHMFSLAAKEANKPASDVASPGPDGADVAQASELQAAITSAIEALPTDCREVFERRVTGTDSYADVSRDLRMPKGTVATRVRQARRKLFADLVAHMEAAHAAALTRHYATN